MEDPHLQAFELARIALSAGRPLQLRVVGDSMYPLLQANDSIWVAPVSMEDFQLGDLVVLSQAGELVTHRMVHRGPEGWHTKGDNRLGLDPYFNAEDLLGRVVAVERGGNRVNLQNWWWERFNGLIGVLSWWEARLYNMGRRLTNRRPTGITRSVLRLIGFLVGELLTLLRRMVFFLIQLVSKDTGILPGKSNNN